MSVQFHGRFRESALTKLLMDSLGGNTKTLMVCVCVGDVRVSMYERVSGWVGECVCVCLQIACIAPGESHLDESLSTVE